MAEGGVGLETSEVVESTPRFVRMETAGNLLSESVRQAHERRGIRKDYEVRAGVYTGPKMQELIKSERLDPTTCTATDLLELAKKNGYEVAYYAGGIGHGIQGNNSELARSLGVAGKSPGLPDVGISEKKLHEKLFASTGKKEPLDTAVDFLEGNYEVVFTSEPPNRRGVLSSPAADAEARKTIVRLIRETGVKPDVFLWSNSGFKIFREFLSGFYSLSEDINQAVKMGLLPKAGDKIEEYSKSHDPNPVKRNLIMAMLTIGTRDAIGSDNYMRGLLPVIKDALLKVKLLNQEKFPQPAEYPPRFEERLMPVHSSGYDFLEYLDQFRDVDIAIGGSPDDRGSLTFPVVTGDKTIAGRLKTNLMLPATRELIGFLGDNDQSVLFDTVLRGKPLPKAVTRWIHDHVPESVKGNRDHKLFPIYAALMTGHYLPGNFDLLVSRLAEMGRAHTPSKRVIEAKSTGELMARAVMSAGRGDGVTAVVVNPGVGEVVDDTRSKLAATWESLTPRHVMVISGKPHVPHSGDLVRTGHGLIREKGVINQVKGILAGWHLGLVKNESSPIRQAGRVGPADTEARGVAASGSMRRVEYTFDVRKYQQLYLTQNLDQATRDRLALFTQMFVNGSQRLYPVPLRPRPEWLTAVQELWELFSEEELGQSRFEQERERWIPKELGGE